jgi:hypothetical protein
VSVRNRASVAVNKAKSLLNRDSGILGRVASDHRLRQQLKNKNREISTLRKELARARGGTSPAMPAAEGVTSPVFFVVGYQKSGTTWLMKMLDSHPEVLCQGEGRPFGRNWRQENLKRLQASYPPASLYNAMLSAEDLRYWVERSVWTKRDDTDEHLGHLTRLAIEYFLTQRLLVSGKKQVGDKTVLHEPGIVREIGEIFPEARVIHIIRDGRDVAVSAMHHRWNQARDMGGTVELGPDELARREAYRKDPQALVDAEEGIFPEGWLESRTERWAERIGSATKDGPATLGSNYAEVRYEDLLDNPEREMERLFGHLGADTAGPVVKGCVEAASFEKLSDGRERGEEAASFFRKGIAGDWKNTFTKGDKEVFKSVAGDLLVQLGYERDRDW